MEERKIDYFSKKPLSGLEVSAGNTFRALKDYAEEASEKIRYGFDRVKDSKLVGYIKGANDKVDRFGENICYNISNNPTSEKWIGRHKGTLAKIGALAALDLGVGAVCGHYAGPIADNTKIISESAGRSTITTGWPFPLQKYIETVNSVPPYVHKDYLYYPENSGKNAVFFGGLATGVSALIETGLVFANLKKRKK